jgi:hypothetical protein
MTKCSCGDPNPWEEMREKLELHDAQKEYESIFKESDEKIAKDKKRLEEMNCPQSMVLNVEIAAMKIRLERLEQQTCHNGCWNCPHIRKKYCNYNSLILCENDMCSQNCPYYPGTYVPIPGTVTWM